MGLKTKLESAKCPLGKWGDEVNKEETIFISIASYRDPDLVKTVMSAWNKAKLKNALFFSIVSQAEDDEHPDLSFIPKNQINYIKFHWKESKGACWAREIASRNIIGTFFFQIDSHSRFRDDWDVILKNSYKQCQSKWGRMIVLSNYPDSYTINWDTEEDVLAEFSNFFRLRAEWDEQARMIAPRWEACEPIDFGHEVFFVSANNLFCLSEIMKEVPYDSELYFTGEEPSLALRFYTRGIKIINPPSRYMYTNYDRENGKRNLHWGDNQDSWWHLNQLSYQKLAKILTGDLTLGKYGIGSFDLFKEYQEKTGMCLEDKFDIIYGN
jgi:hypothetical protein